MPFVHSLRLHVTTVCGATKSQLLRSPLRSRLHASNRSLVSQGACDAMNEAFRKFAHRASEWLGSPWAFTAAFTSVAGWAILGLIFGFSDSWQLLINTSTTIVTFLMVFLIQNTQNRDNRAIHAKLDELIVKTASANNELVESEEMSEEELRRL